MLLNTLLMQARNGQPSVGSVQTLKHFFPMSETSGPIITDTAGGVIITPTEISFDTNTVRPHEPLGGYASAAAIPSIPLTSGSWADLGTDSFCLLAVAECDTDAGDDNAGSVGIHDRQVQGDILPGIGTSISTTNANISGLVNVTGGTADDHYTARPTRGGVADGDNGDIFMLDLRAERTTTPGTVFYKRWNETDSTAEDETVSEPDSTGTSFENATACTPDDFSKFRGLKLYGVALFQFSGPIPDNYEQAALWMSWAWQQGYKTIWPNAVEWT